MLLYNVRIAIKSLRRNPVLTAVIIGGIALGICVSTTFITVRHMFARDPLPGKERQALLRADGQLGPAHAVSDSADNPGEAIPPQITIATPWP